ncbi:MAG TPA: glycosyltransferase family 2 protein [Pseudolabrys sp.]|jgi:glycosyltransferase involved in cell wall biosynthesis
MTAPYASVFLPTLNRSATLPYALASVQRQSQPALEIFIVLDGATTQCREIATRAAQTDQRITVLDLPKDSGVGENNLDIAVTKALGQRIFYIDDDDLWLPDHIARLGPLLEHADVVDSRVCSLDRRGELHLGPCRASNRQVRELLATGRLKMLYDTHFAHRRDAYRKFSNWVSRRETGDIVWNFLSEFAKAPECKWVSCDAVTALSIHGSARADMSSELRALEISDWLEKIDSLGGALACADSFFHLFRLLIIDAQYTGTLDEYLSARGGYGCEFSRRERDIFALLSGSPPAEETAIELAVALAEPVESGYMFESVALACFEAYGQETHERILSIAASRSGPNLAARLAAYSAALARRDHKLALEVAQSAVSLGPDPVGSLARWYDKLRRTYS